MTRYWNQLCWMVWEFCGDQSCTFVHCGAFCSNGSPLSLLFIKTWIALGATVKPRGGSKRGWNNPLESERYARRRNRAGMSRGEVVGIAVRKRPNSSAFRTRATHDGLATVDPKATFNKQDSTLRFLVEHSEIQLPNRESVSRDSYNRLNFVVA
jgi:hypothetical protein